MLSLLAYAYGKVVGLRNYLYDRNVLDSFDLGARTISVGNLTTGGTGKTPLVAYIANVLADRGEKVCILTRGYGREDEKKRVLVSDGTAVLAALREAGDEPIELAQKLIGKAIVIADADRIGAAEWAKRKFGPTTFVLDDGFQHRRVRRDLDIVCIDATDPFGGRKLLPAGRLRERVEGLSRANAIVITRTDLVGDISDLRSEISNLALSDLRSEISNLALSDLRSEISNLALSDLRSEISNLASSDLRSEISNLASSDLRSGISNLALSDLRSEISNLTPRAAIFRSRMEFVGVETRGKRVFAFCGIANSGAFFEMLKRDSVDLVGSRSFSDHHSFSQTDIDRLQREARERGAEVLLTTAKDAVKLSDLSFDIPYTAVEIEVRLDDAERFAELL